MVVIIIAIQLRILTIYTYDTTINTIVILFVTL